MIEALRSLIDTIIALVSFFTHAIFSLFVFISKIPQYVVFLSASLNTLPEVIIPFAVASVSVYVLYFVLNRE